MHCGAKPFMYILCLYIYIYTLLSQRFTHEFLVDQLEGGNKILINICILASLYSKILVMLCDFDPGGLALLNVASEAFVAAPTPAAPSLRGNASMAQAEFADQIAKKTAGSTRILIRMMCIEGTIVTL